MCKFIARTFIDLTKINRKNLLFPALGIGRATVLCNNAELANPCKARPRRVREHPTSDTGHRWHGTPRTDVGRADVGIKSRRNGRRRSGVCQTPATAKKKKPDGFPRNGRYHEENVGCFIIHPTEPDPFLYDGRYY